VIVLVWICLKKNASSFFMNIKPYLSLFLLLLTTTFSFAQFQKGYYYTSEGKKIEGLLKIQTAFTSLMHFVIGKESFTTAANLTPFPGAKSFEKDFVQVYIEGRISVYIHHCEANSGNNYFHNAGIMVLSNDRKNFLSVLHPKLFREEIAALVSSNPEIQNKVLQKKVKKHEDLIELVKEYNKSF
jgi:hypothetical protein